MARPPKEDPTRVNQRTGRVGGWRPRVMSLGPDYVYSEHFGKLWQGPSQAMISGHAQLFGVPGSEVVYSFEALPGSYAFLINTTNPLDVHLVADLNDYPLSLVKRAHALCGPLAAVLTTLGLLSDQP